MSAGARRKPHVIVATDANDAVREAAHLVVQSALDRASPNDMFTIALSGGHTPEALLARLAAEELRAQIPWDRTQVFFSDERFVPPDSEDSNFRMANDSLLSHVPVPERFIHGVPTVGVTPEEGASNYEEGIRRVFNIGPAEVPRFDLILLGLGPDGHTASLFPDTHALYVTGQLVAANFVPQLKTWRITFTFPLLDAARCVIFLVQGRAKAAIVKEALTGDNLPASRINPHDGKLIWVLDAASASDLPDGSLSG